MIKVPLKKEIILSTSTNEFICQIIYAGKDTFQAINVYKRIYIEDGTYRDVFLAEKFYFDRECIIGYTNYEKIKTPVIKNNQACKVLKLIKKAE